MTNEQLSPVALRSGSRREGSLDDRPAVADPLDRAMDRYADGEDAAFDELARGLTPRLRAFLLRLSGSRELADDLTQETFLRIHRSRGSFARGSAVVPWAFAIGRNCFMSQARAKKTRLSRRAVDVTTIDVATGPDVNAEATVAAQQSATIVSQALAAMPVANREAFVLIRYEGMSVATAAQLVGISEGALKLRAFRAYEILRAALKEIVS
ncbi:MAG TPA: RNA polymerase sigma factor [Polyangiaceae bacterium]|nr:RNA polymerase sigma factor [Polyangiaceae bacterium]